MGLLDAVVRALGQSQGGQGGGQADLLGAVIGMLGQGGGQPGGLGGLAGLVAKFQQNGLGDVANSWVGTGQNMPIAPEQLGGVLGNMLGGQGGAQAGGMGDLAGMLGSLLKR